MNPPVLPSAPPKRRPRWLLRFAVALGVLCLATPAALGVFVWSCLHTSRDLTVLRKTAQQASGRQWERKVEFSAGRIPLALGRVGLRFAPVDVRARWALNAVREAEAAVFESTTVGSKLKAAEVLAAVDATMAQRGWERTVGVQSDDHTVAIYLRPEGSTGQDLHACVLVVEDSHLVVASARIEPKALLKLIEQCAPEAHGFALNF